MRVEKIHFEELFPTGIYANLRLRAEVSISEGESAVEAFKLAKDTVQQAFQELNPNDQRGTYVAPYGMTDKIVEPVEPRDKTIEGFYGIINMKNITAKYLSMHREPIEALKDEALTKAFEDKLNSLK